MRGMPGRPGTGGPVSAAVEETKGDAFAGVAGEADSQADADSVGDPVTSSVMAGGGALLRLPGPGGVGDAAQGGDRGAAPAPAEDDPGRGGDQVGEGLLLPLAAVFGDPQRGDAGGADGDDGGPAPVGAAVGVRDDDRDVGTGVGDQRVAQGAGGGVRVGGPQPGALGAGVIDPGERELVAQAVPGDDRDVGGGQEVVVGGVDDQLHERGRACPSGPPVPGLRGRG